MKITLHRIELENFKGIRALRIDFNEHVQSIFGANETGKSTVFNAFLWLLFGKDMEGRKDYEIKTTDKDGNPLSNSEHPIDHSVTAILQVGNDEHTIKRIYREKWVKPRGAIIKELAGHETEFFWNDVPFREKDYTEKIGSIVKEDVFKLLTNPLFFNVGLTGYKIPDWQARRNVLLEIGGKIDDSEIAMGREDFKELIHRLSGKTLEEYKKELSARKKKVKEVLDFIPARIDEATKSIPEAIDFDAIERDILAKESEISLVDKSLTDLSEAEKANGQEQLARQREINAHELRLQAIDQEVRSSHATGKNEREARIRELQGRSRIKDGERTSAYAELKRLESHREQMELRRGQLRTDWATTDAKMPDSKKDDCKCPACGQDLPADTICEKDTAYNKYVSDFNTNKAKRLAEIQTQGKEIAASIAAVDQNIASQKGAIETLEKEIEQLHADLRELEEEHSRLTQDSAEAIRKALAEHAEAIAIRIKIRDLKEAIEANNMRPDNSDIRARRQVLTRELDEFKKKLFTKGQIETGHARVKELADSEKDHAQQLADIEKIEHTILNFEKARIDALEQRINGKFQHARFKLFDRQVNGQEIPCCETTYKGVVFGSLNTAAKVLVGIDIINVLSAHYGVSAPVFLDNRESVSSIPDTDAQIINLIVSPDDKELRVA